MKLIKCLKHALNMVLHSRLRSWLTIIGIVIGVASVIAIISLGDGLEANISSQLNDAGADVLTITPGYSQASGMHGPGRRSEETTTASDATLTRTDVQVLKGFSEIEYIDTQISGNVDIYYLGEEGSMTLKGVDQKVWKDMTTEEIGQGRLLDSADSNVLVIGEKLSDGFFDEIIGINKVITIEGTAFRIVGILDGGGNSIYMPINSAYNVIDESVRGEYDSILVQLKEDVNVTYMEEEIEEKFMISRHVDKDDQDFTVSSNSAFVEMQSEMLGTMTLFLTGIAAISLLVGSVGIANTMFTSVLEKKKDIGIMKAIGAKNKDILSIFLFNAAIIGLIGGLLGLLIGWLASLAMGVAMGMNLVVSFQTIAMSIGVSVVVGIISGSVPAYQASQLNPVDSLRSE